MGAIPSLPDTTDVVVIGGGVMGTSIAFYLATQSDRDVVVVEKDNVAAGSTGDSSSNIRHNYGDRRIYTEMVWWSQDVYRNFEEHTGRPMAYVNCKRVRWGKNDSPEGDFIMAGHEVMKSLGIPTRRVEKDNLEEEFPMFDDVDRFDFAITEEATAYGDATDAANGFAAAATDNGATLVTGTEVTGFDVRNDEIVGVETEEKTVSCNEVIVAAGPWTPQLGERVDVNIPITPSREEVLILDPPEDFKKSYLDTLPMTRFYGGEWYMRPDFGDGVLLGTHPFAYEAVDPDSYSNIPDEETILQFVDLMEENISGLVESDIRSKYCGIYSTSPDHDYIIDQAGPDGCYFVTGFSGHGFKHAPAIGKMMRDYLVDGDTDLVDIDFFSLDRFADDSEGYGRPQEPL